MSYKGYFAHETLEAVSPVAAGAVSGDRPRLIGITGFKRSGKDTTASVMADILGYDLIQFAGPLKDMLRTLLRCQGIDETTIEACVEGDMKEAPAPCLMGKTPRLAMQTLGTEWGREVLGDTIWVDTALRRAAQSERGAIITDVRFANEAQAIRDAGGVIIRVERPEVGLKSDHPSEREVASIQADHILRNDRSRSDYEEYVAGYAWRHFARKNS